MSDKFEVTWEADDGYAGGSAPHRFTISADDIEGDMTDAEIREWFWEAVQEDFNQRVSPTSEDENAFFVWVKKAKR
jgi:hypothetical protein